MYKYSHKKHFSVHVGSSKCQCIHRFLILGNSMAWCSCLVQLSCYLQITHWDLTNNKLLRFIDNAHPPGFGVLNIRVSLLWPDIGLLSSACSLFIHSWCLIYMFIFLQFTDDPATIIFNNTGGNVFLLKFKLVEALGACWEYQVAWSLKPWLLISPKCTCTRVAGCSSKRHSNYSLPYLMHILWSRQCIYIRMRVIFSVGTSLCCSLFFVGEPLVWGTGTQSASSQDGKTMQCIASTIP